MNIDVDTKEEWIDYLTNYSDIFGYNYIGYWARGIDRNEKGWLLYEMYNEEHPSPEVEKAALKAWHNETTLPPYFFVLDKKMAEKAYVEGVKKWGMDWYEKADANYYDYTLQMAILGETRYG